jgi:hypothetical protein
MMIDTFCFFFVFQDFTEPNAIKLYVRRGSLPTNATYDYTGCTESAGCGLVSVFSTSTIAESLDDNWYIGITSGPSAGGRTVAYGIWEAAVCANNCNGQRGTCNLTGSRAGTCSCSELAYSGIDCSAGRIFVPQEPPTVLPRMYHIIQLIYIPKG